MKCNCMRPITDAEEQVLIDRIIHQAVLEGHAIDREKFEERFKKDRPNRTPIRHDECKCGIRIYFVVANNGFVEDARIFGEQHGEMADFSSLEEALEFKNRDPDPAEENHGDLWHVKKKDLKIFKVTVEELKE